MILTTLNNWIKNVKYIGFSVYASIALKNKSSFSWYSVSRRPFLKQGIRFSIPFVAKISFSLILSTLSATLCSIFVSSNKSISITRTPMQKGIPSAAVNSVSHQLTAKPVASKSFFTYSYALIRIPRQFWNILQSDSKAWEISSESAHQASKVLS